MPTKRASKTATKKVAKASKAEPKKLALPKPAVAQMEIKYATDGYLEEFIHEIAGKDGLRIIDCMGDGCTDESIEQKTDLKIAEVRCILNHLHSYGIVEYKREKNMQNGWFTYTWSVNRERALSNYMQMKRREYDELRKRIAYAEGANIYKCKKNCANYEFDIAMENQFRCPKCKGMLRYEDGADGAKKIESRMKSIETMLSGFQSAMAQDTVIETAQQAKEMPMLATSKK